MVLHTMVHDQVEMIESCNVDLVIIKKKQVTGNNLPGQLFASIM